MRVTARAARHHQGVVYVERPTAVPGAVLWRSVVGPGGPARILPDGCLDVIWDGERLVVAGPDTTARLHTSRPGTRYTAVRFAGGLGATVLRTPADELTDRSVDLAAVCGDRVARLLVDRVAETPAGALEAWTAERADAGGHDPLGPRVLSLAAGSTPVADMADRLSLSPRQLHRRCLALFGYGPRLLGRIVRLGRALETARAGVPLADVAARHGYVDQAHLTREVRTLTGTTPTALLRE